METTAGTNLADLSRLIGPEAMEVVVLSTPDYLHHLQKCLASFRSQIGEQIRLTVVHTGGQAPALPGTVRAIRCPRMLGCGAARELGRPVTSARWVLYTDADVCFPEGFLSSIRAEIERAERFGLEAIQLDFEPMETCGQRQSRQLVGHSRPRVGVP
jgi:hypothetical protein